MVLRESRNSTPSNPNGYLPESPESDSVAALIYAITLLPSRGYLPLRWEGHTHGFDDHGLWC